MLRSWTTWSKSPFIWLSNVTALHLFQDGSSLEIGTYYHFWYQWNQNFQNQTIDTMFLNDRLKTDIALSHGWSRTPQVIPSNHVRDLGMIQEIWILICDVLNHQQSIFNFPLHLFKNIFHCVICATVAYNTGLWPELTRTSVCMYVYV